MSKKQSIIYKIYIPKWDEHNKSKKKNHRYFMIENRFFSDDKISQLNAEETRLYVYLLSIASDINASSYQFHVQLVPNYFRIGEQMLLNCLKTFESLQLLNYEKSAPNTRENKTKQYNTKENSESLTQEKDSPEKQPRRASPPDFSSLVENSNKPIQKHSENNDELSGIKINAEIKSSGKKQDVFCARAEIQRIYKEFYPLKKKWEQGLKKLTQKRKLKDGEIELRILNNQDLLNFEKAVKNYAAEAERNPGFVMGFASFAGEWHEYIEEKVYQPQQVKKVTL